MGLLRQEKLLRIWKSIMMQRHHIPILLLSHTSYLERQSDPTLSREEELKIIKRAQIQLTQPWIIDSFGEEIRNILLDAVAEYRQLRESTTLVITVENGTVTDVSSVLPHLIYRQIDLQGDGGDTVRDLVAERIDDVRQHTFDMRTER